jgi:hypothetical protein
VLRREPEQALEHGECDEFGIVELWCDTNSGGVKRSRLASPLLTKQLDTIPARACTQNFDNG